MPESLGLFAESTVSLYVDGMPDAALVEHSDQAQPPEVTRCPDTLVAKARHACVTPDAVGEPSVIRAAGGSEMADGRAPWCRALRRRSVG